MAVAQFLESHDDVEKVLYPGKKTRHFGKMDTVSILHYKT